MAQLAIAAAGATAGFFVGGPVGAQIGWALGALVGSMVVPGPNTQGPRVKDATVTGLDYGEPIPWIAGHPRVAGQIWWASEVREISTTTSQGKGGGASYTSYTYEADILYGLCSREITGVSRIWSNGKLVWSMHPDSSDESIAASRLEAPWEEITVYTGASDQLPDPTYEAAVGVGNAPAYRGRGSVMIGGLQLGTSGVPPVLTFEVVVDGSTSPPLTILQSYFDANVSDDISAYDRGPPDVETYTAPGFGTDAFRCFSPFGASGDRGHVAYWDASDFAVQTGQACTWEFFVDVDSARDVSYDKIFTVWTDNSGYWAYSLGIETGSGLMVVDNLLFGFEYTGTPLLGAGRTHIAFVSDGVNETRIYRSGVLVHTIPLPTSISYGSTGRVQLGGVIQGDVGAYTGEVDFTIDSFRMRLEEVYTGSSFTPPSELPRPDGFRLLPDDATLRDTVEALCTRAGMADAEVDASALDGITKPVRALVVAQGTSTRAVIEQLMAAYYFGDFAADKLYFVPRGGSVLETIDADWMGAAEDQALDELLPTEQQADEEIPAQVSVNYANVDADYNVGSELSDRILSNGVSVQALQLGLGFTPAEAKGIADAAVLDGYSSRISAKFCAPYGEYAELTPTDIIRVPDEEGNLYRVRIVRRTDNGPQTEFEVVLDDASVLESAGITSGDYTSTVEVSLSSRTALLGLDIPLLRDADDKLGHYIVAKPESIGTTWPGALVWRGVDGVTYTSVAEILERAVFGETRSVLPDFDGGITFDEVSTVTVDVGAGTLSSSTRAAMLLDTSINAMLIGDEIIRFRSAVGSDGVYVLSGLLRGQLGTEWAMGAHVDGERAVLLTARGMRNIDIDLPSLGVVRYYIGVTLGRTLQSGNFYQFTVDCVRLKPLAPVQLRALEDASGNFAVTWHRRTRLSTTFTGPAGSVVPLGEQTEWYQVQVLDDVGGIVWQDTVVTVPSVTISPPSPGDFDGYTLQVWQMSSIVGDGYMATLTL